MGTAGAGLLLLFFGVLAFVAGRRTKGIGGDGDGLIGLGGLMMFTALGLFVVSCETSG